MALLTKKQEHAWDPFAELREISDRLNRSFAGAPFYTQGDKQALANIDWTPSVNVSETDKAYLIRGDIPDVKKEDIKISAENGMLTIEGERKQQKSEQSERFHRVESSYGRFVRRFTLPDDADESAIEANYKDGSLTVRVPKAAGKEPKAKQIKVG
jgi:HSP20 family protein